MNEEEFLRNMERISGNKLNDAQKEAILYGKGPLMIIAGPGSGKTEVLVQRCLKLMIVDEIKPNSIIFTTFTRKAAEMIRCRIDGYLVKLGFDDKIDSSLIWMGTLHSLCDRIMKDFRFSKYIKKVLMDEMETQFFLFRYGPIRTNEQKAMWTNIAKNLSLATPITNWAKVDFALPLFNRLIEDRIDLEKLSKSNEQWHQDLYALFLSFQEKLEEKYRCDFANVQNLFLNFLNINEGDIFLLGDKERNYPRIEYILVDEYQDTNPVQEAIYFKLAKYVKNFTIVGDDDQALYRFRGGTVNCIVDFPEKCKEYLQIEPKIVQLLTNYRSNPKIVEWLNEYIRSFEFMDPAIGARTFKKDLLAGRNIPVRYPPITSIIDQDYPTNAYNIASLIETLKDKNIIQDYSQIALLFKSTREVYNDGFSHVGEIVRELNNRNIPTYNPRSKSYLENFEIKLLLGTISVILDLENSSIVKGFNIGKIKEWIELYHKESKKFSDLSNYVNKLSYAIKQNDSLTLKDSTLRNIIYRIYSFEPFVELLDDSEYTFRLGQMTQIIDSYSRIYDDNLWNRDENSFKSSLLRNFYFVFLSYLKRSGIDELEVEEQIAQGKVQIMTIHQSKGLEFPFVFVGSLNQQKRIKDIVNKSETLLASFRSDNRKIKFDEETRVMQDIVRLFYVAFSRAEYSLILIGSGFSFKKSFALGSRNK